MDYAEFLKSRQVRAKSCGFDAVGLNPNLKPFQKELTEWACRVGRCALFCGTGLGKTLMQLAWSDQVVMQAGGKVLVLAPLAVSQQTVREGAKFGIKCSIAKTQYDCQGDGIFVTNYQKLDHFDASQFIGVVLDESSILKSLAGKVRAKLTESFATTPYRLCCTATPAPNDHMELGNHAEFLGIMRYQVMLATWFIHDTSKTQDWRLKGHAVKDFWRWVASWAMCVDKPSDIGHDDEGYNLPPLNIIEHVVDVDATSNEDGMLFRGGSLSSTTIHKEMRLTASDRARKLAEIVGKSRKSWMLICNTNYESDAIHEQMDNIVEIRGSDKEGDKEQRIMDFCDGKIKRLLSKPTIVGFGLNFQHCCNAALVGLSFSWEQFFQIIRRFWRFGQTNPVNIHVIIAETEGEVLKTIKRKEADFMEMRKQMLEAVKEGRQHEPQTTSGVVAAGDHWTLRHGDCVEEIRNVESDSIGLSVFSPPFSSLYVYSDDPRDMGNCQNDETFFDHFRFLIPELYRVTKPGRLCAVHCGDLAQFKFKDGTVGLKDFPGWLIEEFTNGGWVYHSRVTIWKDPVVQMQRTKAMGLLYKQLRKDSTMSRQGLAEYVVVFRKHSDDVEEKDPVTHDMDDFPLDQWQQWASPVWMDIDQGEVLDYQAARAEQDERHICPLQLGVTRRCIALWSNRGDTILSPFAGIGSEGHVAIGMERKFIGLELKDSYFKMACTNLKRAEQDLKMDMFRSTTNGRPDGLVPIVQPSLP